MKHHSTTFAPPEAGSHAQQRTLNIVFAQFLLGVVVIGVLPMFNTVFEASPFRINTNDSLLANGVVLFSLLLIPLALWIKRWPIRLNPKNEVQEQPRVSPYFWGNVLCFCVLEFIACMGLMAYLSNGNPMLNYITATAAGLAMIYAWPRRSEFKKPHSEKDNFLSERS